MSDYKLKFVFRVDEEYINSTFEMLLGEYGISYKIDKTPMGDAVCTVLMNQKYKMDYILNRLRAKNIPYETLYYGIKEVEKVEPARSIFEAPRPVYSQSYRPVYTDPKLELAKSIIDLARIIFKNKLWNNT